MPSHALPRASPPLSNADGVGVAYRARSETSLDSSFCTLVNLVIVDRNSDGTDIARARCRILVSILHTYQSFAIVAGDVQPARILIRATSICREQHEAQLHFDIARNKILFFKNLTRTLRHVSLFLRGRATHF